MLNRIITFLKEVRLELKKVNWLNKKETVRYTLIVIAVSVAVAVFLGTIDFLLTTLLNEFVLK
jgi:preprotein translocase subunit SecE